MRKPRPDKGTRLIETAMKLAYRNGFRETSLADIAEAAHVPVGNVYYYFKTKEELGEAVVERRLAQFRAFREEMDRLSSPKERLFAFVGSIHSNRETLARGGCPLGGRATECAQEEGPIGGKTLGRQRRSTRISAMLPRRRLSWMRRSNNAGGNEYEQS